MRSAVCAVLLLAAPAFADSARVKVGRPAPPFTVTTVEGQRLDLASLRGKRVLIFTWASW
jgi:cytochrome c biogenesis protein CcmG/thiol:disulfide interchange protein DsbE